MPYFLLWLSFLLHVRACLSGGCKLSLCTFCVTVSTARRLWPQVARAVILGNFKKPGAAGRVCARAPAAALPARALSWWLPALALPAAASERRAVGRRSSCACEVRPRVAEYTPGVEGGFVKLHVFSTNPDTSARSEVWTSKGCPVRPCD